MAKGTKVLVGDVFLIPRSDEFWVVGQVLEEWMPQVICIGVFDCVLSKSSFPNDLFIANKHPFAMPSVAKVEISKGYWPHVGHSAVTTNLAKAPHRRYSSVDFVGAKWHSGKVVQQLVDAYYGLGDWEPYPGRPGELKSLMLQPDSPNEQLSHPG